MSKFILAIIVAASAFAVAPASAQSRSSRAATWVQSSGDAAQAAQERREMSFFTSNTGR